MAFTWRRNKSGDGNEDFTIDEKELIGMSKEDLATKVNKIDGLATQLEGVTSTLDAIKNSFAALENKLSGKGGDGGEDGGDGGGNSDDDENDPNKKLLRAVTGASVLALEVKVENLKTKLRIKTDDKGEPLYPYWDAFEADMDKLGEKDPIQYKTQEQYWDNAYSIIFRRRFKDIEAGTLKAKRTMKVESGGGGSQQITSGDDKPSELDILQAKKFNIPIEKYMKQKKEMQFV